MPVTSSQVATGVRAGWGAITRMEVSGGGKTNWDGTKVKEKFASQTNNCDTAQGWHYGRPTTLDHIAARQGADAMAR